ncbi:Uma2 family endonuclease [Oscillatoria sp. FACHB-1406]|uniref:Uma2 family endonuclease n=1 Tax=Oscillatoria sp. FACHB-1406 TaxID=2692846 RepID=UPI0016824632|nr:Uma2 family endonuclease [Oscillatoria sp. FACHB-1406]MBD2576354.1 Uma2 family endonuclease [Oscillatoria sp. FACHB-1406]
MTQTLDKPKDQRLIHVGLNWEQFKFIQKGFSASPGIHLFYYEGEVEILSVSQDHEFFSRLLSALLFIYCLEKRIPFAPTGSFSQEKEGVASVQADESYFIGRNRTADSPPNLSIEVVFSSGNEKKLSRYQALEVPEVWFWEDGLFSFYHLREFGYQRIARSEVLPELNINLLTRCLLMSDTLEAASAFRQGILEN